MRALRKFLGSVPGMLSILGILVGSVFLIYPRELDKVEEVVYHSQQGELRVSALSEEAFPFFTSFGALYKFDFMSKNSSHWLEIMTFRHDDFPAIKMFVQYKVVHPNILIVFVGWKMAISHA